MKIKTFESAAPFFLFLFLELRLVLFDRDVLLFFRLFFRSFGFRLFLLLLLSASGIGFRRSKPLLHFLVYRAKGHLCFEHVYFHELVTRIVKHLLDAFSCFCAYLIKPLPILAKLFLYFFSRYFPHLHQINLIAQKHNYILFVPIVTTQIHPLVYVIDRLLIFYTPKLTCQIEYYHRYHCVFKVARN